MKKSSILCSQRICDRAEETGEGSQLEDVHHFHLDHPRACLPSVSQACYLPGTGKCPQDGPCPQEVPHL